MIAGLMKPKKYAEVNDLGYRLAQRGIQWEIKSVEQRNVEA
jgi:hypothetical protein